MKISTEWKKKKKKISTEWEKLPSFVPLIAPKISLFFFLLYPLNKNRYDWTAYTVYHGCYKIIWIAYGYIWHQLFWDKLKEKWNFMCHL